MKYYKILIIIAFTLPFSSCIYYPKLVDIPLINKKKDLRIDASVSPLFSANSTISYGLTDKIAIQTYGSIENDLGHYYQGAVGYYKVFKKNTVFELYGGIGNGYRVAIRDAGGSIKGDFQSYFSQINIGKVNCAYAHADYGFGLKTGILHSNLLATDYYDINQPTSRSINNQLQVEPELFARFGGNRLKFNVKIGGCWFSKFTNTDKFLPYYQWNLGLGLNFRL